MSVNAVSPSFTGQIATTKKGNQYEKTNTATKVGAGVAVLGEVTANFATKNSRQYLVESYKNLAKKIGNTKAKLVFGGVATLMVAVGAGIGAFIGSIIDASLNKQRAAKADEAAA